jgi:hypothetical protein
VLSTDFVVSVHGGPNGENPTGSLVLSNFLELTATPTCLSVVGNRAVIGYRVDTGSAPGRGFITEAQDNGEPVNGQPVDTTVYNGFIIPSPISTCPRPGDPPPPGFSSVGAGPLLSGDITIIDAPPLPTSKDQCKNGGWRDFAVFKNQGDCVSFVATKGKNPPAGN